MKNKLLVFTFLSFGIAVSLLFSASSYKQSRNSYPTKQILGDETSTKLAISNKVTSIIDNGDGSFNILFIYSFTNINKKEIEIGGVQNDLRQTFNGFPFKIVSFTGNNLSLNTGFNGMTNNQLLSHDSDIKRGQPGSIYLTVRYTPRSGYETFSNNLIVTDEHHIITTNQGTSFTITIPEATVATTPNAIATAPVPTSTPIITPTLVPTITLTPTPTSTPTSTPTPTSTLPTTLKSTPTQGTISTQLPKKTTGIVTADKTAVSGIQRAQVPVINVTKNVHTALTNSGVLGDSKVALNSENVRTMTFKDIQKISSIISHNHVLGASKHIERYSSPWVLLCIIPLLLVIILFMIIFIILKRRKDKDNKRTKVS